ncbi:glycosyltransferase [Pseudomonadota bacterium]
MSKLHYLIHIAHAEPMNHPPQIAVVIPCYRVGDSIVGVVAAAIDFADTIICVDDACPDNSGRLVQDRISDPKVRVLFNEKNLGVGGAVKVGYRAALEAGCGVVIKLDGDGQMDPAQIPMLAGSILKGESDYCKGNRFHDLGYLKGMPTLRVFGNSLLSVLTKISSGYWQIMDPTNGYTAIGYRALSAIPLDKVSDGYFFESDMLFRLNVARAVVSDVPLKAHYGDEVSNLRIGKVMGPFAFGNLRNFFKRIFYNYYLRDFNLASLELLAGMLLTLFGGLTGARAWAHSIDSGVPATAGTVMLSGLPIIIGFQLLLSFLSYDIQNVPRTALSSFEHPPGGA